MNLQQFLIERIDDSSNDFIIDWTEADKAAWGGAEKSEDIMLWGRKDELDVILVECFRITSQGKKPYTRDERFKIFREGEFSTPWIDIDALLHEYTLKYDDAINGTTVADRMRSRGQSDELKRILLFLGVGEENIIDAENIIEEC